MGKMDKLPSHEGVPKEIERKFLISKLPENLEQYAHEEIIQGYVQINEDGSEERLRKKGNTFFRTVKGPATEDGKTRDEEENEISKDEFDASWGQTSGRRIEKNRYTIPHDGLIIELDMYHGVLDGLVVVEVEFPDEETSENFVPPDWFGAEVTSDARYKNQSLAVHGKPTN